MPDRRKEFSISCSFSDRGDFWLIQQAKWQTYTGKDGKEHGFWSFNPSDESAVVFRHRYNEREAQGLDPPAVVRAAYERLIGYDPEWDPAHEATLGEIAFAGDEEDGGEEGGGFNQPCKFGNLAPGHKVYCTNAKWLYAPSKCCRTWYTGGETRDEDCEGFAPNPRLTDLETKAGCPQEERKNSIRP
jgi:hypothetical protein